MQKTVPKNTYQLPPSEILELADYTPAPFISLDMRYEYIVYFYQNAYKTLDDLMQPEMRLAGRRINPVAHISTSTEYSTNIKVGKVDSTEIVQVQGLPENARLANLTFSPDERYMAFTHTAKTGLELWILNIAEACATKILDRKLNAFFGNPVVWLPDSRHLIVMTVPENQPSVIEPGSEIPEGPVVIESSGEETQNRTYQDLLKNETDARNFEILATSELYIVDIEGKSNLYKESDLFKFISVSPDGEYVMLNIMKKPFSFTVPYSRFASTSFVCKLSGEFVKIIAEIPLNETLPKGAMSVRKGMREISWRADVPATLSFVVALDDGNPALKVDFRDELFVWDAPFDAEPCSIFKLPLRFTGVFWHSAELACVVDYWHDSRRTCTYLFSPGFPDSAFKKVFDFNYQDIYSNPGSFEMVKNEYNKFVLASENRNLFLVGQGYTENGKFPFIDKLNIDDLSTARIYQTDFSDRLENIVLFEHIKQGDALVKIQSATEYPNFFIRNVYKNTLKQITFFENPFESLKGITKSVLKYVRKDGVQLSGTFYLPKAYNKDIHGKLPLLIWAYPVEHKDKISAGQSTANPNEFIYPHHSSFVYWVNRGFAVLDDASFPVVGEGDEEPNDTLIQQLVQNAEAAIEAAAQTGCVDTSRVGIGGHSYGAFMVANLLTHTGLFKCGVARSGAYNRTLTPFGFQGEQRNYWDAKNVYDELSPFRFAEKMKTPLLLVHGENDNNSGTYTMQTERYFQALQGLGAPVRMIILPKEKHSYAARENILHLLWEQDRFFEKYLK